MGVQQKYLKQSPVVPTYDYQDIADGTGYADYYGTYLEDSTGKVYKLVRNTNIPMDSNVTYTESLQATNTNLDFEVEYNFRRVLRGDAIFSIPFSANNLYASPETFTVTLNVSLWHIDADSNETQLGSTITEATSATSLQFHGDRFTGSITVPETIINPGEKIRLRVNLVVGSSSNAGSAGYVYHDPADGPTWTEDGSIKGHILNLALPFRIFQ